MEGGQFKIDRVSHTSYPGRIEVTTGKGYDPFPGVVAALGATTFAIKMVVLALFVKLFTRLVIIRQQGVTFPTGAGFAECGRNRLAILRGAVHWTRVSPVFSNFASTKQFLEQAHGSSHLLSAEMPTQ